MTRLSALKMLDDYPSINKTISNAMRQYFFDHDRNCMEILEAGCGSKWDLDLADAEFTLTGVDILERDLEIRKTKKKDLDIAIVGDLRSVSLEENEYDIIYNSFVLEHVDGAEKVLENFIQWVKPGGIIVLKIPDRDTCFGFYTRTTPLWVHFFYRRYVVGNKNAGKPGFGPFPVYYDKVVSRKGIHAFCEKRGLEVQAEYGTGGYLPQRSILVYLANALVWLTNKASFGNLAAKHSGLVFVIKKPSNTK